MNGGLDIDATLVTEGTYPFHHGGVTVWCDQLVRGLPDRRFAVIAITGAGDEEPVVSLPDNLVDVRAVPIWGRGNRRRERSTQEQAAAIADAHEALLASLTDAVDPEGELLRALRTLHELSHLTDVGTQLRGDAAVGRVHASMRRAGVRGRDVARAPVSTVGDAVVAGDLIERFLRPLWVTPPESRLVHCVSNGLSALVGFAAKWTHGTPMVLTEHGACLRERYLSVDCREYSFPVRALVLRFFRVLTGTAYRVADLITPGSEYNLRGQMRAGADQELIPPVHNGVDPSDFPDAGPEPEAPTLLVTATDYLAAGDTTGTQQARRNACAAVVALGGVPGAGGTR